MCARRALGADTGRIPALAIIAAGAALRFWDLGSRSVSFDEALGLLRAFQPDLASIWAAPPRVEFPLFHVVLHYWMLAGAGEAWARALSALFSSASLFLAWGILRRLFPAPLALGSLALFAFSPFEILLAQDARPYGIVVALHLGSFLLLLKILERPSQLKWALWALLAAAGALAHLVTAVFIPAQVLFLAASKRGRRLLMPACCWGLAALAPAAAAAYWLRAAIGHAGASGLVRADPWNFALGLLQNLGVSLYVPSGLYLPGMAVYGILAALGAWVLYKRAPGKGLDLPSAAVAAVGLFPLAGILLANWAGVLYLPKPRYAAPAHLFLLAACAAGALAPRGRLLKSVLLSLLLVVSAGSLLRYFRGAEATLDLPPYKKPLRSVAGLIRENYRQGDSVLSVDLLTHVPMRFYLEGSVPLYYSQPDLFFPGVELYYLGFPRSADGVAAGARRVWLVCAPFLRSAGTGIPQNMEEGISRTMVLRDEWLMPGIRVQLWEREGVKGRP